MAAPAQAEAAGADSDPAAIYLSYLDKLRGETSTRPIWAFSRGLVGVVDEQSGNHEMVRTFVALAATWVFVCGAFLAVTLGGAEGLRVFCLAMYMLAIFLWGNVKLFHAGVRALGARVSHFLFHVGPEPRRPARGTSDDPVMVFDDDEGKRVDHPIEVG